jgi:hypothetical protein
MISQSKDEQSCWATQSAIDNLNCWAYTIPRGPRYVERVRKVRENSVTHEVVSCEPLRGLQGRFVSNAVSNAGECEYAMANIGRLKVR